MVISTGGNEALMANAAGPEEDFSILPLQDRLAHKNWKARVNGYEALIKNFSKSASETDAVFKPYINDPDQIKRWVTDSNAVAQEKGVECALGFVKFAGEYAAKTRDVVVPALLDKCLGATRAGTKSKAIEIILEYIEVCNTGEGVVADLLPGLNAKQPKTVAATLTALKESVKLFGVKTIPPKPLFKALPKVIAASDKGVRAEAIALTQELYRYLGDALLPLLSDLPPAQVKLLALEELDSSGKGKGTGAQERYTREQAREAAARAAAGEEAAVEAEEAIDPRSLVEAKDVFKNIPASFHGPEGVPSKKWQERKDALEGVLALLREAPVVADTETGQQSQLIEALRTVLTKDSNIMVVVVAANVIEAMAKGLGASFARHRGAVTGPLLDKLKERKQNVIDALGAALDAVCANTSLGDMTEDILAALKNKSPQVKENTLRFLHRSLLLTRTAPSKSDTKSLSESLAILLGDSMESVRVAAADCMGALMKIVGERTLNPVMEPLDEMRKARVKEAFEKVEVKFKGGAPPPPPPPAAAAKGPPKKAAPKPAAPAPSEDDLVADEPIKPLRKPPARFAPKTDTPKAEPPPQAELDMLVEDEPVKPVKKPPARFLAKKAPANDTDSEINDKPANSDSTPTGPPKAVARPPVKKPAAAPAAAVPQPKKAAASSAPAKPSKAAPLATDTFKYKYSSEDAEGLIVDLIPPSIATGYSDPNWKTRLAAMEEMEAWVGAEAGSLDSELVFRFLGGKKRDWNEKNFQVSSKVYAVLTNLAEKAPSFGKASAALAIPHLTEKLGDIKLKKPAGETLIVFAEKTSLSFVLGQAYDPIGKQKAPKVLADSLLWISQVLSEFGVAGLALRTLVDFLKTALQNSNAAVRQAATTTLVTLRLFAGAGIKDFLSDLNPQLLTTISSEFDKVEDKPAPEPSRSQADLAGLATSGGAKGAAGGDPMDSLYPRVDLDKLTTAKILTDAKSDAWKARKEALEALQASLNEAANKRLKGNMGEIGQVLQARVVDTNKMVQALALDIIGRIATAMNKPFEKYSRQFVVPVASVLSDQKAPIRAAALITLTAMANGCESIESFTSGIAKALEVANPLQRSNLLNWVADWFKEHEPSPTFDLTSWAAPLITCLDDKSGDVRRAAQGVLPTVIEQAGFDFVLSKISILKAASQQAVRPMIMAARPATAAPAPITRSTQAPPPIAKTTSAITNRSASPPVTTAESVAPRLPLAKPLNGISGTTGVRSLRLGGIPSRPQSRAESGDDSRPGSVAAVAPAFKSKLSLKRPTTMAKPSAIPVELATTALVTLTLPFSGSSLEAKRTRLAKDRTRWNFEALPPTKDVQEALQHQMEPHTSKELLLQLFSHDHNADRDHMTGLSAIDDCYVAAISGEDKYGLAPEDMTAILIANADLPLKYASLRLHESNPSITVRCLDVLAHVLALLDKADYSLSDAEVATFVPNMINKFSDSRDVTRDRIRAIFQALEKQYPYSKIFQLLLEHGLKSKAGKTRQAALDELASLINKHGMRACEPAKAYPVIASMISDRDPSVRQSALTVIGEGYILVGETIWTYVGTLSEKDKATVEERLRRLPPPAKPDQPLVRSGLSRITSSLARPASPSKSSGIARAASPGPSRLVRPRALSPTVSAPVQTSSSNVPGPTMSRLPSSGLPVPGSRPKSMLPSRLAQPRSRPPSVSALPPAPPPKDVREIPLASLPENDYAEASITRVEAYLAQNGRSVPPQAVPNGRHTPEAQPVSVIISQILNNDPDKSVKALKRVQEILEVTPDSAKDSELFKELAEHTEGLIETMTLQMAHVFDRPDQSLDPASYRLAKYIVHTLNTFLDHTILAESLTVDSLTSLLEELTLRLLQTDDDPDNKVKDLSRFINLVLLRIFAVGRRISVFRSLFGLLLRLTRPFTSDTSVESREVKVTDLVLKCIWKMARGIPADLEKGLLDPCELFPCVEAFLQSIPPNEWRMRAANKVPEGDMPLRTVKVMLQHLTSQYGEDVYDQLSACFDDPSATIVYPYVYRILNASKRPPSEAESDAVRAPSLRSASPATVRTASPQLHPPPLATLPSSSSANSVRSSSDITPPSRQGSVASFPRRTSTPSRPVSGSTNGYTPSLSGDDDAEARLIEILDHISSETTGLRHKQGITELHHFLKTYPHKKPRVDKMLDATGPQFRKYIARALASRAEDEEERELAVADTLSRLENNRPSSGSTPSSPGMRSMTRTPSASASPRRASAAAKELSPEEEKHLTRLHDIFGYQGRSSILATSPQRLSGGVSSVNGDSRPATSDVMAQLASLRER